MNRRQRRAQEALDRRKVPVLVPVCSHPRDGWALGCPSCGEFDVRVHLVEADDCEMLMCCVCGEKVLTYRPHAPASFIAWLEAEVARLDAGGEPPEPCEGGREAYAAHVRERLSGLLLTHAEEQARGVRDAPAVSPAVDAPTGTQG